MLAADYVDLIFDAKLRDYPIQASEAVGLLCCIIGELGADEVAKHVSPFHCDKLASLMQSCSKLGWLNSQRCSLHFNRG